MGGLTVLKAVAERLPNEDLVYYGDTAHLPYGNKSSEAVARYSLSIARYLTEKGIKLLIVACNTASVFALEILKAELSVPVIGVVEPGVSAATGTASKAVGVIGTYGTIKSGAYENAIKKANPEIDVVSRACPLFVPFVEEGWIDHPVTSQVADIYLGPFAGKVDSVILGCTHYPVIKHVIEKTLGSDIIVVDSALEVAKAAEKKIIETGNRGNGQGSCEFYVSDAPELFKERGPLFLGKQVKDVALAEMD